MPLCLCGQSKEVIRVQRETEAAVQAALRTNQWSHRTQGESHTWFTWSTKHLVHTPGYPGLPHTWSSWRPMTLSVRQSSTVSKYRLGEQTFSQFFPDEPPCTSFSPAPKGGARFLPGQVI